MEEKSYHIRTNDPDVISKIENFNAYGFTTRKDFIFAAVKMYDTFTTSEETLRRVVTEAVMEGLIGVLNVESDTESNSDPEEDVYSNYDSINNIDLPR